MISLSDYLQGRDATYANELTIDIRHNAVETTARANRLIAMFDRDTGSTEARRVNSGWRPAAVNWATPGAAPRSKHMTGQAIDISDPEGDLDQWCLDHLEVLEDIGLWLEHPSASKGWCHVQTVPPKSGRRVFYP